MNGEVEAHLARCPAAIRELFASLRACVFLCAPKGAEVREEMWARMPSYFAGEGFVRLIPFGDHVNVEAVGLAKYREALSDQVFTPKGMMKVYPGRAPDQEIMTAVFRDSLF